MPRHAIGGFASKVHLGEWIRDYLADGKDTWAYEAYRSYRTFVDSVPYSSTRLRKRAVGGRSGRKGISYQGFILYLYYARKAGLIEYTLGDDGEPVHGEPVNKAGDPAPQLIPTNLFHLVPGAGSDPGWSNLRRAAGYA